jgi:hypothetical protein
VQKFLLTLGLLAATFSLQATTLDGDISSGEYTYITTLSPWVNGADASGGTQNVKLYWATDANNVYGAVVGDLTQNFEPFANIYVYSSGASTDLGTTAPGVYGDGNDILIEGTSQWGYGQPTGFIPGTQTSLNSSTAAGVTSGSSGGVSVAYNAATLTEEFSISKALLGNYDVLRFGGQLFSYEFDTGSDDRVPGALVPESLVASPEPTTWMMMTGALFGLLVIGRSRFAKN